MVRPWKYRLTQPALVMLQQELFIKFAEFEEKVKEDDRARAIFRYALDHIPKVQAQEVYRRFVAFEKQHGNRDAIEVCALPPAKDHLVSI